MTIPQIPASHSHAVLMPIPPAVSHWPQAGRQPLRADCTLTASRHRIDFRYWPIRRTAFRYSDIAIFIIGHFTILPRCRRFRERFCCHYFQFSPPLCAISFSEAITDYFSLSHHFIIFDAGFLPPC
jgi:hypothetical protein